MLLESILLNFLALVFLYLPGYISIRGISKKCSDLDSFDLILLSILISFLIVSSVAFSLALVGLFHPILVWSLCMAIACLLYFRLKCREFSESIICSNRIAAVVGLSLIVFAYHTFGEPFEWMTFFNLDVGRYSNIASSILNSGGIGSNLPAIPGISSLTAEELFLPTQLYNSPPKRVEEISTPYLHLFPAIYALFRAHVGIFSSFQINWVLLTLSAASFYLLIKLALNSRTHALAGAALLFSSPASYLYGYKTMAEISCQLLVSILFVLLFLADRTQHYRYLIFSALSSFLLASCRLEFALFFLVIPALYFLLYLRGACKRTELRLIILSYSALSVPLGAYYFLYTKKYLHRNLINLIFSFASSLDLNYASFYFTRAEVYIFFLLSPVLIIATSYWLIVGRLKPRANCSSSIGGSKFLIDPRVARIIQMSFIVFLGWSFFIRPELAAAGSTDRDAYNLLRLLTFIDPLTVCLATLSIHALVREKNFAVLYVLAGVVVLTLTLYRTCHLLPDTRWIRRYVVFCIPVLYFTALASCCRLNRFLFLPYFIFAFSINLSTAKLLTQFPEQKGVFELFQKYSSNFGPFDLQLCANRKYCDQVATPVGYHFGIKTLNLQSNWNLRMKDFFNGLKQFPYSIYLTEISTDYRASEYQTFIQSLKDSGIELQLVEEQSIATTEYIWDIDVKSRNLTFLDKFIYRTSLKPAFRTLNINFRLLKLSLPQ